jgi:hypothetical protein
MDQQAMPEVEAALTRACRRPNCLGRDAIIEAAGRGIIPETDSWMVKNDDGRLRLYALRGVALHELDAECRDSKPDERETVTCHYRARRLTGAEKFTCEIKREAGGNGPLRTGTTLVLHAG